MLDLSFHRRTDMLRKPIILKSADSIMEKGQDAATLILVAVAAGLLVWLVWGVK